MIALCYHFGIERVQTKKKKKKKKKQKKTFFYSKLGITLKYLFCSFLIPFVK